MVVSDPMGEMGTSGLPLSGIRVLDLSRDIAGPMCAQLLGDLGADVIKVEHPERGDEIRGWRPKYRDSSTYYLVANRNKRSLTLDLKSELGREILEAMIARSAIVVENFRIDSAIDLRLTFDDLRRVKPDIVTCSIRGYGRGTRSTQPAYDAVIQAFAGIMSVTGQVDGDVARVGVALVDFATGVYAASATLAALKQASETETAVHVEVSLFETGIAAMAYQLVTYLMTGEMITRTGTSHPAMVPAKVFDTATDQVFILAGNDVHWRLLCEALSRPDWAVDERYRNNDGRVQRRAQVHEMVEDVLTLRSMADWAIEFDRLGVPYAPVRTVEQVANDPDVLEDMVRSIRDAEGGEVQLVRAPILYNGASLPIRKAPPEKGEDTDSVLLELGYSPAQVEAMRVSGVV